MNYETLFTIAPNNLIEKNAAEFVRAIRLIEKLSDEIYPLIGAHIRHNLDFINAFLSGLKSGKIDYEKRRRDIRIEQNRQFAIEQIIFSIQRIQTLTDADLKKEILVRSEVDENLWHVSSATRELEFLHSHTIHHHALIAEKLNNANAKVSGDFGVAPSTLKFWKEQRKKAV